MRLTLATLPLHAVDLDGRLTLRHGSDDAPGTRVAVLGLDADALLAAAPHLGAELTLTLCDGAPAPGPSRDELAGRLAEAERELADRARELTAADDRLARLRRDVLLAAGHPGAADMHAAYDLAAANALATLAARVDREPPQRAAGLGAGVDLGGYVNRGHVVGMFEGAADHMEWVARNDPSPAVRDAVALLASRTRLLASTLLPATARQDVRSADRGAEAVEPRERVGSAVERVVVAEGVAAADAIGSALIDGVPTYGAGDDIRRIVRQHEGRRVRLVVEIVGEGGSVHGESVSPAATTREAHS